MSLSPPEQDIRKGNCPLVDQAAEESARGVNDCGLRSQMKYFWAGNDNIYNRFQNRCAPLGAHYVDNNGCCYNKVRCIATSFCDNSAFCSGEDVCQSRRSWDMDKSDFPLLDEWIHINPEQFVKVQDRSDGYWTASNVTFTTVKSTSDRDFKCLSGCYGNVGPECISTYCRRREQTVRDTGNNQYHCYNDGLCVWNGKTSRCIPRSTVGDVCAFIDTYGKNDSGALDEEQCTAQKECKLDRYGDYTSCVKK